MPKTETLVTRLIDNPVEDRRPGRSQIRLALGSGIVRPLDRPLPGGAAATIDDGGGPVIASVHAHLVFWGSAWTRNPNPSIDAVTNAIWGEVGGPYMSALAQYRGIRRGLVVGRTLVATSDPPNPFQNSDVTDLLRGLFDSGAVPKPRRDSQFLYIVFMPKDVSFTNNSVIGEHFAAAYVDPTISEDEETVLCAWVTNKGTLDSVSEVASHEIVEACSDPQGTAFQIVPRNNNSWNEIGDSGCGCQSVDTRLNGLLVQKYWSQLDRTCVAPETDIRGLVDKAILGDTSDCAPALASHDGRLFIAWKGSGNDNLNLMFSEDNGHTFSGKRTFGDTSDCAPALVSHNGVLLLGWKGSGNDNLNVARVDLFASTAGGFGIEGLSGKVILGDTSSTSPALASHEGRLYLAWKGSGNENLNLMFSEDGGRTFTGKMIFGDTTDLAPALASHAGHLFLGWRGSGNENLNVARVLLGTDPTVPFAIGGLVDKVILPETSTDALALASHRERLFLAWKGSGNFNLNLNISYDRGRSFGEKRIFGDTSDLGPALCEHADQLFYGWKGSGNDNLNVARVDLYESLPAFPFWRLWFPVSPGAPLQVGGSVSALVPRKDHIDLFATAPDGSVWSTWWEPQPNWQRWFPIHPETKLRPGATVTPLTPRKDHIDLFAAAADGTVWSTWWEPGPGWQGWFPIHAETKIASGATVTALVPRPNHIDLFATAADGTVLSTWWEAQPGWQRWFPINAETKLAPGATVTALVPRKDHIDLFATAADGSVWSTWWEPQPGWQPWFAIHPETRLAAGATVAALVPRKDHIDLFATGADGVVRSTWWEPQPGWQRWFAIDPDITFPPGKNVTALLPRADHIDLFLTGNDGSAWSTFWE